jgi:hypothetical protein
MMRIRGQLVGVMVVVVAGRGAQRDGGTCMSVYLVLRLAELVENVRVRVLDHRLQDVRETFSQPSEMSVDLKKD